MGIKRIGIKNIGLSGGRRGSRVTGPNGAPSALVLTTVSTTSIRLDWTNGSTNEDSLSVERSPNGSTWVEIATPLAGLNYYVNIGLTEATRYYYRVRALKGSTYSAYSNEANTYTLPLAPSGLTLTVISHTEIQLDWTRGSTNNDGTSIERSPDNATWAEIATVTGATVHYHNTGLSTGTLYYYRVREYNVAGYSSYSNTDSDTTWNGSFKITVDTTKAGSANKTFVLPLLSVGTYDYYVDWGDGGAEEHKVVNTSQTKVYAASGTYQIKIRGTFPQLYFATAGDRLKLMSIDNWGNITWTNMTQMFHGCANMTANYSDTPNTSSVISMYAVFRGCTAFNGSVLGWDLSGVTHIDGTVAMFEGCTLFNQPVNHFDMHNVYDIHAMFQSAPAFNQPVSDWVLTNCVYANRPFQSAIAFNQPINWSLPAAKDLNDFLYGCTAFNSAVTIDAPNCLDASFAFGNCVNLDKAITLNLPSCTNFTSAFLSNIKLNSLVTIDSSSATTFETLFYSCTLFNQNITLITDHVTTMKYMFAYCYAFNGTITFTGGTAALTNTEAMFYANYVFNKPLTFLNDTSLVTSMKDMFYANRWLNQNISFNTGNVINMAGMFSTTTRFAGTISLSDTSHVTDMHDMFFLAEKVNCPLNFNTSAVINMSQMLWYCTAFKQNISGFSLASVTNITNMLQNSNINVGATTTNYDALLVAWAAADVPNGLSFHGGTSKYSDTGAIARASLIADDSWAINDGGHI